MHNKCLAPSCVRSHSLHSLAPLPRPPRCAVFRGLQSISTGGADVLSPDCLLNGKDGGLAANLVDAWGSKLYTRGVITAATPLVGIALISLFWRLRSPFGRMVSCCNGEANRSSCCGACAGWLTITSKQSRQRERVSILVLLFITHLGLVQAALSFFVCEDIVESPCAGDVNIQYLKDDPTVRCWEGNHTGWALGLGLPMLLGYGIGIPAGALAVLWWRRRKLDEDRCLTIYGFLYCSFKPEYYYWECLIYARKALFAMAGALLQGYGVELQCSAGIVILFISHLFQTSFLPYHRKSLNRIESSGLVIAMGTLFCGLALESPRASPGFSTGLAFLMFAGNIAYLAYVIFEFFNHAKELKEMAVVRTVAQCGRQICRCGRNRAETSDRGGDGDHEEERQQQFQMHNPMRASSQNMRARKATQESKERGAGGGGDSGSIELTTGHASRQSMAY